MIFFFISSLRKNTLFSLSPKLHTPILPLLSQKEDECTAHVRVQVKNKLKFSHGGAREKKAPLLKAFFSFLSLSRFLSLKPKEGSQK